MTGITTDRLVEEVYRVLSADAPSPALLAEQFACSYQLSREAAGTLVYELVVLINAGLFPPITHMELIHTNACNLACRYCFEKAMLGKARMEPEVAVAAVDLLFRYAAAEPEVWITHFGGEPLLHFDSIRRVTEYAEAKAAATGKRVRFTMTSNGLLLDEAMAGYLARHKISVLVSVDGMQESHDSYRVNRAGHGTFAQSCRALALLAESRGWVGVKMTVMPENAHRLHADVLGLHDLGVNQFQIGPATGVGWSADQRHQFAEQLRLVYDWYRRADHTRTKIAEFDEPEKGIHFGCQAGRNSITVTPDGVISPCAKLLAADSAGTVLKLGDVRSGLTYLRNRYELVTAERLQAAAERQGIAHDYHGGCFATNYEEHGDPFEPSLEGYEFSRIERRIRSAQI